MHEQATRWLKDAGVCVRVSRDLGFMPELIDSRRHYEPRDFYAESVLAVALVRRRLVGSLSGRSVSSFLQTAIRS